MVIVSDTTPIIALIKINQLNLLEKLFGNVKIPLCVYDELISNPLYKDEAEQINESTFIETVSVNDIKSVDAFKATTGLDKGESEAILLSEAIHADSLLMDERKGRQVAKQMGITVIGTLGVLLSAYQEKILTENMIMECFNTMKNSGLRISDSLYNELFERIHRLQ